MDDEFEGVEPKLNDKSEFCLLYSSLRPYINVNHGTKHGQYYLTAFIAFQLNLGEQGWRSGESVRLPPNVSRRRMWVEFVVGSLLCSKRFFSGFSGFPFSSKTNISKFLFYLGKCSHLVRER